MDLHFVERRSPHPDPFTLVLLHGLGSNEEDLMGFAPELPERISVISLRAPFAYGFGGYAWFNIDFVGGGAGPASLRVSPEEVRGSLDDLASFLQNLIQVRELPPDRLIVGGFSQGAMMSMATVLRMPERFIGLLAMSGLLLPQVTPEPPAGSKLPKCLVTHGTYDPVVPVVAGQQAARRLKELGAEVDYREYAMAHEVNYQCLADIVAWLEGLAEGTV